MGAQMKTGAAAYEYPTGSVLGYISEFKERSKFFDAEVSNDGIILRQTAEALTILVINEKQLVFYVEQILDPMKQYFSKNVFYNVGYEDLKQTQSRRLSPATFKILSDQFEHLMTTTNQNGEQPWITADEIKT